MHAHVCHSSFSLCVFVFGCVVRVFALCACLYVCAFNNSNSFYLKWFLSGVVSHVIVENVAPVKALAAVGTFVFLKRESKIKSLKIKNYTTEFLYFTLF